MGVLSKILKDRERRFALRQAMVARGLSSVSLNFNIPGYPKSSVAIRKAFAIVQQDLLHYFVANRIHKVTDAQEALHSDCGDFFLQGVTHGYTDSEVKNMLESFETIHPLGRLLDVDLMNGEGELVSSGKEKQCFLCEKSAKECMKNQSHTFSEYSSYVQQKVESFLGGKRQEAVVAKIAEQALKSTLFEVSVNQKPGLVCPDSNGAHKDMDYFTFLSSSAALADYWRKTASYGYKVGQAVEEAIDYKEARKQLRLLGLEAEAKMLQATQGVNTQKGIIFLIGLGCFSSAFAFALHSTFREEVFRQCLKNVMHGIVSEDFHEGNSRQGTHGEQVFRAYGQELAGGARHEAEQGFPTVFSYTLHYLNSQIEINSATLKKEDWQDVLLNLLLLIISKSNDVNILFRKDATTLCKVQAEAAKVFSMASGKEKSKALQQFGDYCLLHNISPGGAADLLALSLFIYFIQNLNFSDFEC